MELYLNTRSVLISHTHFILTLTLKTSNLYATVSGSHGDHTLLPALQELTRKMADYWQKLVPLPQSALDTIADGAYYTTLIEDKLRVLSFNSDYG